MLIWFYLVKSLPDITMKAVILVGGLGTRLRPLTLDTPKAMVPVLNVPFLEHVLRRLVGYGINEVVLALSHLAPAVEGYFGDGSSLGVGIKYVLEESPLGTAGAARNALGHLTDACLVMNGDIFTGLDIAAMAACHHNRRAKVTIALTPVDNPCAYGLVETEKDGRVCRFLEKPSPAQITTDMINAGTYIVEPEVLAAIPPDTRISFERNIFPSLVPAGSIFAFADRSYWMDIGAPAKYHQLHRDLLSGCAPTAIPIVFATGAAIHPSARLTGRVIAGEGAVVAEDVSIDGPVVLGPGCRLERGAAVSDSVIWRNTVIGTDSLVKSSLIGAGCVLSQGCRLLDCVVGSRVSLPAGYFQTNGQIWPGLPD